jgi:hypothetical protein
MVPSMDVRNIAASSKMLVLELIVCITSFPNAGIIISWRRS